MMLPAITLMAGLSRRLKMYTLHEDGGHAWLEVKRSELIALGILDKISGFSYEKDDAVYLEEDCDMAIFCRARNITSLDQLSMSAPYRTSYEIESPVRNYDNFRGGRNE